MSAGSPAGRLGPATIDRDLRLADGHTLRATDGGGDGPAVFWHHGTRTRAR